MTPGCCSTVGDRGTQSSIPYRKPREIWHRAHDENPHTSDRAPERQQLADPRAKGNCPQEQMGSDALNHGTNVGRGKHTELVKCWDAINCAERSSHALCQNVLTCTHCHTVICFLCSTVLGVRVHPTHSERLLP